MYRFDVQSDNHCFSKLKEVPEIYRQPVHMDELCYLFKPDFMEVHVNDSVEWDAMERMVDLFVNFATHGEPGYVGWDQSTSERAPLWGCSIHANDYDCDELPEATRMRLWDDIVSGSISMTQKVSHVLTAVFLVFMFI